MPLEMPPAIGLPPEVQPRSKRQLEWDIELLMEEAAALFRAEVVLQNELNNPERDAMNRVQRAPFLTLAAQMTEHQRKDRWRRIEQMLNAWWNS